MHYFATPMVHQDVIQAFCEWQTHYCACGVSGSSFNSHPKHLSEEELDGFPLISSLSEDEVRWLHRSKLVKLHFQVSEQPHECVCMDLLSLEPDRSTTKDILVITANSVICANFKPASMDYRQEPLGNFHWLLWVSWEIPQWPRSWLWIKDHKGALWSHWHEEVCVI